MEIDCFASTQNSTRKITNRRMKGTDGCNISRDKNLDRDKTQQKEDREEKITVYGPSFCATSAVAPTLTNGGWCRRASRIDRTTAHTHNTRVSVDVDTQKTPRNIPAQQCIGLSTSPLITPSSITGIHTATAAESVNQHAGEEVKIQNLAYDGSWLLVVLQIDVHHCSMVRFIIEQLCSFHAPPPLPPMPSPRLPSHSL